MLSLQNFLLLLLAASYVVVWIYIVRQRAAARQLAMVHARRLKTSQEKLQQYIGDLDNLLVMLVGIHEFGMTATGIASKEELNQSVIDSACRLLRSDAGSLMMLNHETNELTVAASRGLSPEVVAVTRLKIGEGVAGRVAETGKGIFVEDIKTDVRFLHSTMPDHYTARSFISVPLRVKNRIIGVLNVNSVEADQRFEERDVRLLTILADQAAITLENIDLYDNLQNFYLEMVQTLARAIDAKDAYTHEHADRARRYARLIGHKLNLPAPMIRHIEYAALMHDIGKIGIDEQILHKAGKLTQEERAIIMKHPSIGNRILAPVAFLSPIAPMVLYHQEWYNGQGYPEGLRGEEIPLGARIVAAIDAFDAITSDRPYRKALPRSVAIEELQKGAGTQFDPKVVIAFLDILEEENSVPVS
ncbi:MAG: HD domain-containing phosphohydrolase [Endomicrobiales bacterium]|jgi:HD-GYP domain-containing protein (c-di-GMP phosphodiesterase class II)